MASTYHCHVQCVIFVRLLKVSNDRLFCQNWIVKISVVKVTRKCQVFSGALLNRKLLYYSGFFFFQVIHLFTLNNECISYVKKEKEISFPRPIKSILHFQDIPFAHLMHCDSRLLHCDITLYTSNSNRMYGMYLLAN